MPLLLCVRCGKKFSSETNRLQHMNQPVSRCLAEYQERLAITNALLKKRKRKPSRGASDPVATVTGSGRQQGTAGLANISVQSEVIDFSPELDHEGYRILAQEPVEDYTPHVLQSDAHSTNDKSSQSVPPQSFLKERHPTGGAVISEQGKTFMDGFGQDQFADERLLNGMEYYPFASGAEWQVAAFLVCSGMSQEKINEFLRLELIRGTKLSFATAADLFSRIEILPKGPTWRSKFCETSIQTKQKNTTLFFRDPIECLQSLLLHPLMKDHIQYTPFKLFDKAKGMMRVYTEWLSGDRAWEIQNSIPFSGATVLGTVLSSDKTTISQMTGNKTAYPLLISLANIDMDFRMKGSNQAFMLLALLPVPSFTHPSDKVNGMLGNRFTHECLSFILEPLKIAARVGVMLSDALGKVRHCYTPLAAYIVDTPESTMLAGVAKGASSVTTALQANFGDDFKHSARTALHTWQGLEAVRKLADPSDLEAYQKASSDAKYNGVDQLFWMDWPLADPSVFLTPEPLHHWNKGFWDHDAKWCIHILGPAEINFRFSILQPRTGYRHFKQGISGLKQVTGREHRDVERYIVSAVCGAVPRQFLVAIRSLMDFRYLAQSPQLNEESLANIEKALKAFHDHKQSVLDSGARDNKKGKTKKWAVPKLEFLQSVAWNIRQNGVALQWSADGTERAHIDVIKNPSENTNNQNYESQIVRHLDRQEKCRAFDLGTAMRDAGIDFRGKPSSADNASPHSAESEDEEEPTTAKLLGQISPAITRSSGGARRITDYFAKADFLCQTARLSAEGGVAAPGHLKTFSTAETAFHLKDKPDFKQLFIEEAAALFDIPDLQEALIDYFVRGTQSSSGRIHAIGGRRGASQGIVLPFSKLAVWKSVRIQNRGYFSPHPLLSPQTVNASPPDRVQGQEKEAWIHGRFDPVVANFDAECSWPHSGLRGHQVVDIRLIFSVISDTPQLLPPHFNQFLTYARRYDIVPQANPAVSGTLKKGIYPDPDSSLFLLRRAKRANDIPIGDIMPLHQVRALVDLVPNFGSKANNRLAYTNSFHYCTEYWLNKYFDKELFLALSST